MKVNSSELSGVSHVFKYFYTLHLHKYCTNRVKALQPGSQIVSWNQPWKIRLIVTSLLSFDLFKFVPGSNISEDLGFTLLTFMYLHVVLT